MADVPDMLTLRRHRDLVGREKRPTGRRVLLGLLGVFCLLGLANLFGQRPQTRLVDGPAASLELYSPERVRSGLYFESRFHVHAFRDLAKATIVLEPGWLEGMTLNTITPGPVGEASRDGQVAFELGHIAAGRDHLLFLHFQVNPTNVGHRSQNVDLYDGDELLLSIDRSVTVFP